MQKGTLKERWKSGRKKGDKAVDRKKKTMSNEFESNEFTFKYFQLPTAYKEAGRQKETGLDREEDYTREDELWCILFAAVGT